MPAQNPVKLTLRLDGRTVEAAKRYARERGTSVSKLVENYFRLVASKDVPDPASGEEEPDWKKNLSPITRSLVGIAKGSTLDEEDYKRYLEEKHR